MESGTLLFALLSQAAPVAALLDYEHPEEGLQHRIYPLVAPPDIPRPYCCFQLIDRVPEPGSSKACRLGDVARVQLSLFADDYATLARLTEAITAELNYAEPEPGVFLEPVNQQDHHDARAICLFRSLDYRVELP